MLKAIILIPARYDSSRFPGKPLALISGLSLIQRVYQNCQKTNYQLAVVTDHDAIEKHVRDFGGEVVRVDDDVQSGTERIQLAYQRFFEKKGKFDLIINVQGDEPLLDSKKLIELAKFHAENDYDIATMVKERSSEEADFSNPNVVKAVYLKSSGFCPYFSRASVPFNRTGNISSWFQHVGVYSYRPAALNDFCNCQVTELETTEKLEQLRAIELGMKIGAVQVEDTLVGVDTPEDIEKVEEILCEQTE